MVCCLSFAANHRSLPGAHSQVSQNVLVFKKNSLLIPKCNCRITAHLFRVFIVRLAASIFRFVVEGLRTTMASFFSLKQQIIFQSG